MSRGCVFFDCTASGQESDAMRACADILAAYLTSRGGPC
jgi:hypothetical protein